MKTLDDIVDEYYNAILRYESYLKEHELKEEPKKQELSKLKKMSIDIKNLMQECYERDCMPWRQIKGDIKEGIKKDLSKRNKLIFYLRAEDAIGDSLSSVVEEELVEYYLKNGFNLNDDDIKIKIEEEIGNCYAVSSLDSKKYSKDTLKLKEIAIAFHKACEDIYKIYTGEYQFEMDAPNKIDIEINNGRILRISQTESDKMRCGIGIETLDEKGNLEERELISEGDFVMLINYYHYVKDNDIQDDFINRNGLNDRKDFKSESIEI